MNSLAIISFLAINLCIDCIQVSDKCDLLFGKDRTDSEGIGVYQSYEVFEQHLPIISFKIKDKGLMFSKNSGKEWKIDFKYKEKTKEIINIELESTDSVTQYDPKSILFLPNNGLFTPYVLVLNKENPNIQFYRPLDQKICNETDEECNQYIVPQFDSQLREDLLKDIYGITAYAIDGKHTGHLILFNINGLLICNTPEGEGLAVNCRRENLRPIADRCIRNVTTTEKPEDTESHPILISIFLVLLILAIILPVVDLILIQRRKDRQMVSTDSTQESEIQTKGSNETEKSSEFRTKSVAKVATNPKVFDRMPESSQRTKK